MTTTKGIQSDNIQKNLPNGRIETTLGGVMFPVSETFNMKKMLKIHFLNTGDILDGKLLHNNLSDVSGLPGQAKKKFKKGDILYSEIRPENRRYMFVDFDASNSVASTKLMILRNKENIDSLFLYKYITSDKVINQFQVIAESRSGTFPQITFDSISHFPIHLPPLPEQQIISSILASFDNKITLLREQNNTLEKITQTIFQEWFVKFNKNNALSKESKVGKLEELVEHNKDSIIPSNKPEQDFAHYSLPAFDNGKKPIIEKGETILSNKYKVSSNSFLVSKLNPSTPRIRTIFNPEDNAICSTEFQVFVPKKDFYFTFCHCFLNSQQFTDELSQKAHGTSSSHQRVQPQDILNLELIIPSNQAISDFNDSFLPLLQKKSVNNYQIESLSKIRDELLPRLMSGEVRVDFNF